MSVEVHCPRCDARHRVEPPPNLRPGRPQRFRCSHCGNTWPIDLHALASAAPVEPPAPAGFRGAEGPNAEPIQRVRIAGESYAVPDLAALQRWILEGRIGGDDEVQVASRWVPLRGRPELEIFFTAARSMSGGAPLAAQPLPIPPEETQESEVALPVAAAPLGTGLGPADEGVDEPPLVGRPAVAPVDPMAGFSEAAQEPTARHDMGHVELEHGEDEPAQAEAEDPAPGAAPLSEAPVEAGSAAEEELPSASADPDPVETPEEAEAQGQDAGAPAAEDEPPIFTPAPPPGASEDDIARAVAAAVAAAMGTTTAEPEASLDEPEGAEDDGADAPEDEPPEDDAAWDDVPIPRATPVEEQDAVEPTVSSRPPPHNPFDDDGPPPELPKPVLPSPRGEAAARAELDELFQPRRGAGPSAVPRTNLPEIDEDPFAEPSGRSNVIPLLVGGALLIAAFAAFFFWPRGGDEAKDGAAAKTAKTTEAAADHLAKAGDHDAKAGHDAKAADPGTKDAHAAAAPGHETSAKEADPKAGGHDAATADHAHGKDAHAASTPDPKEAAKDPAAEAAAAKAKAEAEAKKAEAKRLEAEKKKAEEKKAEEARTREPTSPSALVDAGWKAIDSGDAAKAQGYFDKALQKSPGSTWALYGRGYATERMGDRVSARVDYCQAQRKALGDVELTREVDAALRRVGGSCP